MKSIEFNWKTKDNLKLFAREWQTDKAPIAVICLIHGLGEHSGRYRHVAKAFTEAGFMIMTFDLRGHGKSEGGRGHTSSYWIMLNDIEHLLERAQQSFPELPIFLYGHSLGGNLVLNYVLRFRPKLTGVIVTSPWLKLAFDPPALQVKLGQLMNQVWPSFSQNNGLKVAGLSHDPEVAKNYQQDPLVHGRISARLFIEAYKAGRWALEHAKEFKLPLLLMHGEADPITSKDASMSFANALPLTICTCRIWDNMYHELHNEIIKDEVLKFEVDWINQKLL